MPAIIEEITRIICDRHRKHFVATLKIEFRSFDKQIKMSITVEVIDKIINSVKNKSCM